MSRAGIFLAILITTGIAASEPSVPPGPAPVSGQDMRPDADSRKSAQPPRETSSQPSGKEAGQSGSTVPRPEPGAGKSASAGPIAPPPSVGAPPQDARKTASGLAYKVLVAGTGAVHPKLGDLVTVHYTGWTSAGKMLDSSLQRGAPLSVVLKRTIPGWVEALQSMVVGEKRLLWIPEKIGFQGNPTAPKGMVVYEVELLDIRPGPEVPPPDVAAPPAEAARSASGLAWEVLENGSGQTHPGPSSTVTVLYTGWTTDGKMFDSTLMRDTPSIFHLDQMIPGWTEGLQLMVVGERRRFWIPDRLAYKDQKGYPQGMLVYEVELLDFAD